MTFKRYSWGRLRVRWSGKIMPRAFGPGSLLFVIAIDRSPGRFTFKLWRFWFWIEGWLSD